MKAVICAAGDSKRMGKITTPIPKPLLPFGKNLIIENLLEAIAVEPVNEIIILTGYLSNQIKDKIGNNFKGIPVSYVLNPLYNSTNNMYSIYLVKDIVKEDMLFASGDVYVDATVGHKFIQNSQKNSILVDDNQKYFDLRDPVKVAIAGNKITAIDKKLPKNRVSGVAIGMYKLSVALSHEYFKIAEDFIRKGNLQYGYIEPIKVMIKKNKIEPFFIGKGNWFDIDTPEEYNKAKEFIRNLTSK